MTNGVMKPDPDPTVLTTEALHREIATLQTTIEQQLQAAKDAVASDKTSARELVEEQFHAIQTQFELIEKAADKLAAADKTALAAALQAQKEAAAQTYANIVAVIEKSEAGFTKQIEGLIETIASSVKSLDEKITAVTSRLDRGDGKVSGTSEQRTDLRSNIAVMVGAIGLIIIVLQLIIALATRMLK
jgi:chromosome segregation ATPase